MGLTICIPAWQGSHVFKYGEKRTRFLGRHDSELFFLQRPQHGHENVEMYDLVECEDCVIVIGQRSDKAG